MSLIELQYLIFYSSSSESISSSSTIFFKSSFEHLKKKFARVRASSFLIDLNSSLALYRLDVITPLDVIGDVLLSDFWSNLRKCDFRIYIGVRSETTLEISFIMKMSLF